MGPAYKRKKNSTKRALMASYRALAHAWGPKPKYLLWMWTSVLRPRLTYGAFVWANAAANGYPNTSSSKWRYVD